jgi:hypothetical protein
MKTLLERLEEKNICYSVIEYEVFPGIEAREYYAVIDKSDELLSEHIADKVLESKGRNTCEIDLKSKDVSFFLHNIRKYKNVMTSRVGLKTFLYHFDVQGSYKVLPFLNTN